MTLNCVLLRPVGRYLVTSSRQPMARRLVICNVNYKKTAVSFHSKEIHYQSIHHRFCVFSLKKHLKFKHNGSVDIVLMYSVLSEQRRDIYVLSSFQLVLLCMFRRSIYVYVFIRVCRIPTVYMYVLNPLF